MHWKKRQKETTMGKFRKSFPILHIHFFDDLIKLDKYLLNSKKRKDSLWRAFQNILWSLSIETNNSLYNLILYWHKKSWVWNAVALDIFWRKTNKREEIVGEISRQTIVPMTEWTTDHTFYGHFDGRKPKKKINLIPTETETI